MMIHTFISVKGNGDDVVRNSGEDDWVATAECRGGTKRDFDHVALIDLQTNKEKVLRLIADIFASGDSNEVKERKLGDIIADLETVRKRLAEQKAAALKVAPLSSLIINFVNAEITNNARYIERRKAIFDLTP